MLHERKYIGHIDQLFGVKRYTFNDGKRDGVKAVDIQNGSGLDITILLDKCLDIYQIRYKGQNLNFISPTGIVSPYYYDASDTEWFRSWPAGFLTTCGLSNIGIPNQDGDEHFGLHGRIHNTPAENVNINFTETADDITASICGTMRQSAMFSENLILTRTISCRYKTDELIIEDHIYNSGYKEKPWMILYHFNMGYPLLSENAQFVIPSTKVSGRDEYAQKNIANWKKVESPTDNFREVCYYHDVKRNSAGISTVGLDNAANNLFLRISYDRNILDRFIQWKMFGKGEYVSGLEPCNSTIDGRKNARQEGVLKTLQPGETICCKFKITVADKKSEVENI